MDRRFLPFVLVLLTLTAPAVLAQEEPPANETNETPDEGAGAPAGPVTIDLEAHQESGAFYFTKAGETQRNPALTLPPNTEVTVNLVSVSGFHNFQPDGFPASDFVSDGESTTYTFTTPESGTLQYWCVPHKSSGMVGRIQIQADGAAGDGGAPAPEAPTSYELEAHQEGSAYFFTIKGETQRNPTLYVKPGAEITITLTSVSGFHNIQVEGFEASDFVSDGQTTTYTFTAPESGTLQYWCVPHKSSGMIGRVQAGAPATGGGAGEGPEVSGPAVDLADLGFADCAGYMIPQAAADGVVGGPTVADYVDRCRAGDQEVTTERAKHAADYIIPATWLLIGLGIVGVVYVNRFYKP